MSRRRLHENGAQDDILIRYNTRIYLVFLLKLTIMICFNLPTMKFFIEESFKNKVSIAYLLRAVNSYIFLKRNL